ncbi:MAG TPA: helix-hairpin-helix domain-containing protein [Roseiflexaceae bacterium]|nr:helix-hairpin-helix domain-containing protein [Roseiflexaceae bacterium]
MDIEAKLEILAPAARFDACDTFSQGGRRYTPKKAAWDAGGIVADSGPDGRALPTFRILMSSRCEWNCAYCPLRAGNDAPRAALEPEDLARAFLPRFERGVAQGLFVSTGVDGAAHTATGRMLDGVELLRTRHEYRGYVHVKLLPGAPRHEVERAARLADRLSINMELPSAERLATVSPERDWAGDIVQRLLWARDWQRAGLLPSGIATQFVVGAAGESDRELLLTTTWLYRELELRRVYFGAFRPAPGTPLEGAAPTPFVREQRLKEADWLLRHYGFAQAELPYGTDDNLPLHQDPKLAWALAHPERFPVEINSAGQEDLLRVPGLGPLSVRRILRLRRDGRFRDPAQLAALGAAAARARDFVTLDGRFFGRDAGARARHYAARAPIAEQLTLW